MTDKEFCKLDTEFYGEVIDNIKQIRLRAFNGAELKKYAEHCIKLNTLNIQDVSNQRELFENMQYYMEYCQIKGYITPQDWLETHKHF